jgi:membrane fusion protein (multidrug efflux system)
VVETIRTGEVPVVLEFVARSEAVDTVAIQARVEAILESMEFEEGKRVAKGQVLYRLDKRTFEANLASAQADLARGEADLKLAEEQVSVRTAEAALTQAEAKLEKARQDVARLRPLAEKDAVPRQDLDTALANEKVAVAEVTAQKANLQNSKIMEEVGILQAKANLERYRAALTLAKLDLGYCTITSPIDGLIGRTEVSVGNLVGRGDATQLAVVSSIDPMYVTFSISEEEYLKLTRIPEDQESVPDPTYRIVLADDSVYPHEGKTVTAGREVARETGTLQVVTSFPNPDGKLRPGQFGRIRVAVATLDDAVLVPQRAVAEQQSAKVVLVVGPDDKVSMRTVEIGIRHEKWFVVRKGLKPGERVIVEGQLKARPGMTVKPVDRPVSEEPTDRGD